MFQRLAGAVIATCVSFPVVILAQGFGTGSPMDYSRLKLKIVRTYTVPELLPGPSDQKTLTPADMARKGTQFVVVKLTGTPSEPNMEVRLTSRDCEAKFTTDKPETVSAIGWDMGGQGLRWQILSSVTWNAGAEPFSFSIVFAVPKEVKKFEVACNDTSIGVASLP